MTSVIYFVIVRTTRKPTVGVDDPPKIAGRYTKVTLHGAIDDATHKIVALYFCVNECLLGYYQLLWQIFIRTGGLQSARARNELIFSRFVV